MIVIFLFNQMITLIYHFIKQINIYIQSNQQYHLHTNNYLNSLLITNYNALMPKNHLFLFKFCKKLPQYIIKLTISNIEKMGAGCLSPKPRQGDLAIQLIIAIHRMVLQEAQNITKGPKLYYSIKQLINKTGQLKKLADHLAYHRSKVFSSMQENFQITLQSKNVLSKYTGIIVCETLMKTIYEKQRQSNMKVNKSINILGTSNNFSNHSFDSTEKIVKTPKDYETNSIVNSIFASGSFNKLEDSYISLMSHMLQFDEYLLIQRVLIALQQYGKYHCGVLGYSLPKICVLNLIQKIQDLIDEVIKKLIVFQKKLDEIRPTQKQSQNQDHKIIKTLRAQSLKAYSKLMQSVNWSKNNRINIDYFEFFVRFLIKIRDQNEQVIQLQEDCEIILMFFFEKSQANQAIYVKLIEILDQSQFAQIQKLQPILMQLIQKSSFQRFFFYGLLLHFLTYIAYCGDNLLPARWLQLFSPFSEALKLKKLKNILKPISKERAIQSIYRLFNFELVDINQIITYNSSLLCYAYIFNMFKLQSVCQQKQYKQVKSNDERSFQFFSEQFLQVCCYHKLLKIDSHIQILQTLLIQISEFVYSENIQSLLIDFCFKIVKKVQNISQHRYIIMPLPINLTKSNKLRYIQLCQLIIKKCNEQFLGDLRNQENINTFLFSIYEHLKKQSTTVLKLQSAENTINICKSLVKKKQGNIVYAFFQQLQNQSKIITMDKFSQYIFLYITEEIKSLTQYVNSRQLEKIKEINNQIKETKELNQIIQDRIDKLLETEEKVQTIDISQIKIAIVTDEKIYEQSAQGFNELFKGKQIEKLKIPDSMQIETSLMSKRNSVVSRDQLNCSQASFRDIIDAFRGQ